MFTFAIVLVLVLVLVLVMTRVDRTTYFDEIIEYIPPGTSVLDFGSGNCGFARYAGSRNKTTSLDIHKSCEESDVYDGHVLPYPDNSFDIILAMFVLHHIPHNESIINELKRVCKTRIVLVEDMPQTWYHRLVSRIHYLFFNQSMDTIKHMRSPTEWSCMLGREGVSTIKKLQSGSMINSTPHYIIVKNLYE